MKPEDIRKAALEEAAKICDEYADENIPRFGGELAVKGVRVRSAEELARRIRAKASQ